MKLTWNAQMNSAFVVDRLGVQEMVSRDRVGLEDLDKNLVTEIIYDDSVLTITSPKMPFEKSSAAQKYRAMIRPVVLERIEGFLKGYASTYTAGVVVAPADVEADHEPTGSWYKAARKMGYPENCCSSGETYSDLVDTWNFDAYGKAPTERQLMDNGAKYPEPDLADLVDEKGAPDRPFWKRVLGL